MGDVFLPDHTAILETIKLYTEDVKGVFEGVLMCFALERESRNANNPD